MPIDARRVQLPLERKLLDALNPSSQSTTLVKSGESALTLEGIELQPDRCPHLYRLVDLARSRLGISKPVRLFQHAGFDPDYANACIYPDSDPIQIALKGKLVKRLDSDCLLDVIGHELGHHLIHNSTHSPKRASVLWDAIAMTGSYRRDHAQAILKLGEVAADRFGLLASRDLDAALRVNLVFTTGSDSSELPTSEDAYLKQVRAAVLAFRKRGGRSALGWSHPETHLRAYCVWLFSESDLYLELTGEGPGTRLIGAVNEEISALFRPPVEHTWVSGPRAPRTKVGDAHDGRANNIDDLVEGTKVAVQRATDYVLGHVGATWSALVEREPADDDDDFIDPLREDDDELERRFRELERSTSFS